MTTAYPPPSLDGQWIGVWKLTNTTEAYVWTQLTSASFTNFTSGSPLPAGKTFVTTVLNNNGTEGNGWMLGYGYSSFLSPAVVPGTVPVAPGQSATLGLYGCGVSTVSICVEPNASVVLIATFYPY